MARLYADEDFPLPVLERLRRMGHEVLTTQEAGQARSPDPAQLAFASADGRAILTHNRRDYIALHRIAPTHAGVIVCTQDSDSLALASRIDQAVARTVPLAGQLIRISRPSQP